MMPNVCSIREKSERASITGAERTVVDRGENVIEYNYEMSEMWK